MPKGTPVHDMYEALRRDGMDPGKAARIAQAQTGLSLATGKKPKHPKVAAVAKSFQDALAKAGDYDESKHPRDTKGRWSKGGINRRELLRGFRAGALVGGGIMALPWALERGLRLGRAFTDVERKLLIERARRHGVTVKEPTGKRLSFKVDSDTVYLKALQSLSAGSVSVRRKKPRTRGGPAAMVTAGNIEVAKSFSQVLAKDYPEFDPAQPRADDGTWSSSGGGSGRHIPSADTKVHRQLATVSTSLMSISNRSEAVAARERAASVHASMRRLPETAWRDPTSLDHAWNGYLITVASVAALATVGVLLAGTAAGGVMVAGLHTHPVRAALGGGIMAAVPKFWSSFSYTSARRYLQTLFPGESRALALALRVAPIVGAGTVGIGALLATAVALRYGYRKISTNGEYEGVSSVNRRLELLDRHISSLTSAMSGSSLPSDTTTQQRRVLPYIQAGLAMAASLVAFAGAAKLGAIAYRAAKVPKWSWRRDFTNLANAFGLDVGRAASAASRSRAARMSTAAAASRAKRPGGL